MDKNYTDVVIDEKVYTVGCEEGSAYTQQLAAFVNHKIQILKEQTGYLKQPIGQRNMLLLMNLADDYFKAQKQSEILQEKYEKQETEFYSMKREMVNLQIQIEQLKLELEMRKTQYSVPVTIVSEAEKTDAKVNSYDSASDRSSSIKELTIDSVQPAGERSVSEAKDCSATEGMERPCTTEERVKESEEELDRSFDLESDEAPEGHEAVRAVSDIPIPQSTSAVTELTPDSVLASDEASSNSEETSANDEENEIAEEPNREKAEAEKSGLGGFGDTLVEEIADSDPELTILAVRPRPVKKPPEPKKSKLRKVFGF